MDNGKVESVVVTGCAAGIGRAVTERLLAGGWAVVGVDDDERGAERLRAGTNYNERLIVVGGDVARRGTHEIAVTHAQRLAPLGAWVNNAAGAGYGNLHEVNEAQVRQAVDVNLLGYYWGAAAAVQAFMSQGTAGVIVNISSIHARFAFPNFAPYDVAKGGVEALTRYLAVEYGPIGIRANSVQPGAVNTARVQARLDTMSDQATALREMAALHPLQRIAEPHEIAAVVAFLLSEDSSFISGASIPVDGGATARCYAYPSSLTPNTGVLGHGGGRV